MYPETKHVSYSYVLKSLHPEDERYPYISDLRYDEYKLKLGGYTNSVRHAARFSEESAGNIVQLLANSNPLVIVKIQTTIEEIP